MVADAALAGEEPAKRIRELGGEATGTIGSDEPETPTADALRRSGAKAILLVTDGEGDSHGWAERRELKRADAELALPVVHVQV